jgi:hypothetical protein
MNFARSTGGKERASAKAGDGGGGVACDLAGPLRDALPEVVDDPLPEVVDDPLPEVVDDPLPELGDNPDPDPPPEGERRSCQGDGTYRIRPVQPRRAR